MGYDISFEESMQAAEALQRLAVRWDLEQRLQPYRAHRWNGTTNAGPVLHLDDFSAIPFLVDISGVEQYQHRARLRARQGEMYAATTVATPGYEEYCEELLGLAAVERLTPLPEGNPLYLARACGAGAVRARLVAAARQAGHLVLHPFMGIEDVWWLADSIGTEAAVPVTVVAPPPPTTWIANDKALFDEVVEAVLGRGWLVETIAADSITELAGSLRQLADEHQQVALKRLRCASAMGNAVFESADLREMSASDVERVVQEFLQRTEWEGDEAVLAVAWEQADHSPSTQLWIPPAGNGPPRLDGIYEQLLMGEHKVFLGSRPSTLPDAVNRQLARGSLAVARGLQVLGYAGRCSFDFLVVGDPRGEFQVRFTECNGRWGGTSTPMALLDRLFPAGRPPYRARDFMHQDLVGVPFTELLARVGEKAWAHDRRTGKFLFYNTGPLAQFGKLDVIALGDDQAQADRALEEELPRLWDL